MNKIEQEIIRLRGELEHHNYLYYVKDAPVISDYEYDMKLRHLEELERLYPQYASNNSPTNHVGGKALKKFTPVKHQVALESLTDVFDLSELKDFRRKTEEALGTNDIWYVIEPKVDGLSMSLEYEHGIFVRGSTRGDGLVGEDVTENLLQLENLPTIIKNNSAKLIVRGEVYMPKTEFSKLNAERAKNGEKLFANPRNAAAGSVRQSDPQVTKNRHLSIVIFNLQYDSDVNHVTHTETIKYMTDAGLPTIHGWMCKSEDTCDDIIEAINKTRENFPYDIDGAVLKVDSLAYRKILGSTSKTPRWATAYKYPPDVEETQILDIKVQVGRTGVVTPKAIFNPVGLAGTMITAATLHNFDRISDMDIRIGDFVRVRKAGEIIPEIIGVNYDRRPSWAKPYEPPTTCPICGGEIKRDIPWESAFRCTNPNCKAKLEANLINFASRDGMNIKGLGKSLCSELVNKDMVKNIGDIYKLTEEDLAPIIGKRNAAKLLEEIESSKKPELQNFLYALGIVGVGKNAAKAIANKYSEFNDILNLSYDALRNIPGIGDNTANSFSNWFENAENKEMIKELIFKGVIKSA